MSFLNAPGRKNSFGVFILNIYWPLVVSTMLLGMIGVIILYSVAGGDFSPWAWRHASRLMVGLGVMLVIASLDLRTIFMSSYLVYGVLLAMLVGVELFGVKIMGAQRWLDFGLFRVQPSEFIRLGLILALARYYQSVHQGDVSHPISVVFPVVLIALPCLLILHQPDLGTAIIVAVTGGGVLFLAGLSWRFFVVGFFGVLTGVPLAWQNLLTYQKDRVLVFLNPERDPLGAGYHIIQSKIGIGSGGVFGKGLVEGTQSRLNFLPEKHTDFIFTIFAEELGFFGSLVLLALFCFTLFLIFSLAMRMRSQYARLVTAGIGLSLSFYIIVNLAMVMGLAPVVGVPLPFVSYGGTSLLTFMAGIGVILCLERHALTELSRG